MSHDDIREALGRATPGPWESTPLGSEGYTVTGAPDPGATGVRAKVRSRIARFGYQDWDTDRANAELVAHAPTWLAELLAEVDNARRELGDVHVSLYSEIAMLTARAEAAEAERDQLREEARNFAQALGFGDGRTEPAATLAELVDPLTEAMSDSREHQDCPVFCEFCGERLAAATCEACRGSGCLPNAEMAYLECGTCAGVGKVHNGCAEMTYAQLAASAEAAEQADQRVRECAQQALEFADRTMDDNAAHWARVAAADILRALDGGER